MCVKGDVCTIGVGEGETCVLKESGRGEGPRKTGLTNPGSQDGLLGCRRGGPSLVSYDCGERLPTDTEDLGVVGVESPHPQVRLRGRGLGSVEGRRGERSSGNPVSY